VSIARVLGIVAAAGGVALGVALMVEMQNPGRSRKNSSEQETESGAEVILSPEDASREKPKAPVGSPRVLITKSKRRLVLYSGDVEVCTYKIALGREPKGDKLSKGDGRTPEGEFYVCNRNSDSKYYLSLGLSYPNSEDAARGLADALITREQHDDIVRAIEQSGTPPWDTALGGEIFIHGGGSRRDWTMGCIALENEDIRELFEMVPVGTPVTIEP
jgi:murein L,D-transpeptidase YafK